MRKKTLQEKQAFGHHLAGLRERRSLSPSDLARLSFGEYTDPATGHLVAKGRDRISAYERGRDYPNPKSLRLLAKALGVTETKLIPPPPPFDHGVEIEGVPGVPGRVVLKVTQEMPLWMAHDIMGMILGAESP